MGQYWRIIDITHGKEEILGNLILIWDTGDSYGLAPFRSNLINDVKDDIPVKYTTKINRVIGITITLYKLINSN